MILEQINKDLQKAVSKLRFKSSDIVVSISQDSRFGDYSTNIALQLAKQKGENSYQSALEIANEILKVLGHPPYLESIEVAGGGFINFFIKDELLVKSLDSGIKLPATAEPKKVLIEYGHPNFLKEIHIGHQRSFILGESLSRILESLGHQVFRANYQGDIGLHIAKAIFGIQKLKLPEEELDLEAKAKFLGKCYALGDSQYKESPEDKQRIDYINVALYKKDPEFSEIYQLAREWSLDYFTPRYDLLGVKYDRCFFESEVYEIGKKIVLENLNKVFIEDQGAVIFPGEKYGLHNRVFVTKVGNATYEGKDIGLAKLEYEAFPYDQSVHVVASEQAGYFAVVIKAIEMIFPHLQGKKMHLSYGLVDLKAGKMSSRTGNVITVDDLFKMVSQKIKEIMLTHSNSDQAQVKAIAMGAIKFSYLKYSPRQNMLFDLDQSISLQGDSGPYLQYSYARTQSLLKKALSGQPDQVDTLPLEPEEREILRLLEYFPGVICSCALELSPTKLCEYLLNLAKAFNFFYQKHSVVKSNKSEFRLKLTDQVAKSLKQGLYLLGIDAPQRM